MKVLFLLLVTISLVFCSCKSTETVGEERNKLTYEDEIKKKEESKNKPKPTTPKQYKEPEIGMDFQAFNDFCGKPSDIRSFETAAGKVWTLEYKADAERIGKGCYGTFTFVSGRLETIYQN